MNTKQKRGAILFIKNLPPDLKREFKLLCRSRGCSMTWMVTKLMRDALTERRNP